MFRYAVARFGWLIVVMFGVSVVSFGLGAAAPGDPAEIALARTMTDPPTGEQIGAKRAELGLDRPLPGQYASWLGRAVRGDFGESWVSGDRVATSIRTRLPRTILLAVCALGVSMVVAIPLGVFCAYRRNSIADRLCLLASLVSASMPGYLLAYVLILVLGVKLGLLPVFGFDSLRHLVLPTLTLALGAAATLMRFTRTAILNVLGEDYLRAAQAKGVGIGRILLRHALRSAAAPLVTMLGLSLGGLLTGTFIVEWIFSWPGLGTLAVEAINDKDFPVIQGFVLFAAAIYVIVNFLADILVVAMDPRVRVESHRR